jgi:hypothetical protein
VNRASRGCRESRLDRVSLSDRSGGGGNHDSGIRGSRRGGGHGDTGSRNRSASNSGRSGRRTKAGDEIQRTASGSGVLVGDGERAVRNIGNIGAAQESSVRRVTVLEDATRREARCRVGDVWCERGSRTVTCFGACHISHLDAEVVIAMKRAPVAEDRCLARNRGHKSRGD